ncbi:sulfur oxidation c-type cytochrome SoxX [Hydrogenimonas sp.]
MDHKRSWMLGLGILVFGLAQSVDAADLKKVIEMPDASKILEKDRLAPPKRYTMPKGCITDDPLAIARGEYIFHNLNGKKAKAKPPRGLAKFVVANGRKKPKQYGNCVACHNIEGAKGGGNIGPDLHNYRQNFVDSGVRSHQYVYQQIADPRVHDKNTHMTVNLTTGLFTPREICDIASYVVSDKSKK